MTEQNTISALQERFGELNLSGFRGQNRIVVPLERLFDVLKVLKEELGFDFLTDVTCVDYLHYRGATDRFGMVYLLTNTDTGERITVRCFLNETEPTVPSVVGLWEGANWLEREVWDLMGIRFEGHPDLRRVVLPDAFADHPLRKDYPLQGRGERHNLPVITREEG